MIAILDVALEELNAPTLESTKDCLQFLNLNYLFTTSDVYYIEEIDENTFIVYFNLLENKLFLSVLVKTKKVHSPIIEEVQIKTGSDVCLNAISRIHSLSELENMIGLKATAGWSIGEKRDKFIYKHSSLFISLPDHRHEYIEKKILALLKYLDDYKTGLHTLSLKAECKLEIVQWYHYLDSAGIFLNTKTIEALNSFGLALDYSAYPITNDELVSAKYMDPDEAAN